MIHSMCFVPRFVWKKVDLSAAVLRSFFLKNNSYGKSIMKCLLIIVVVRLTCFFFFEKRENFLWWCCNFNCLLLLAIPLALVPCSQLIFPRSIGYINLLASTNVICIVFSFLVASVFVGLKVSMDFCRGYSFWKPTSWNPQNWKRSASFWLGCVITSEMFPVMTIS